MSNITQFFDTNNRTSYPATSLGTPVFDSQFFTPNIGGNLICKSAGVAMIVAPFTTQVSRSWDLRNDALDTALSTTKHYGWFIPTVAQLQNPGYCCRTFWDKFSSTCYWSSTETDSACACFVRFDSATAVNNSKTLVFCVRAFRCVTY